MHGELAVDYGRRRVSVADRDIPLTATEFDLLRILSLNGGRVVTTEALLRQVWRTPRLARHRSPAHRRQEPPPQARRRCRQSHLHLQRARRRLPLRRSRRASATVATEPARVDVSEVRGAKFVNKPVALVRAGDGRRLARGAGTVRQGALLPVRSAHPRVRRFRRGASEDAHRLLGHVAGCQVRRGGDRVAALVFVRSVPGFGT